MGNADFCSRFPLEQSVPAEYDVEVVRSINFGGEFPVDHHKIADMTKSDGFLQDIMSFLKDGWPKRLEKQFMDIYANQHELELVDGCLLYQDRVIIPHQMQKEILKLLHANHSGIVKMKQLARRTVYWYGINKAIECFVTKCDACNGMAVVPKSKVVSKWTPTLRPFSRIHIDFFFFGHRTYLLIIDSYSKWLEVEKMSNGTDCGKVLKILVEFFARYGLPDVVVSDNGPPFNSITFGNFLERQGIQVMKSPPYNPSSNGQAERLVRTVKDVLKKFLLDEDYLHLDLEDQLNLFLFNYRNNCLTEDGRFPSENIFSFKPKQLIDLFNPKKHYKRQMSQQQPLTVNEGLGNNSNANLTVDPINNLMEGEEVWFKNHNPHIPAKWIKAHFLRQLSKNTFQIMVGNVQTMAHRQQLRLPRASDSPPRPMVTATVVGASSDAWQPESNISDNRRCPVNPTWPTRKRRIEASAGEATREEPRRSKRLRKEKIDKDFIYD